MECHACEPAKMAAEIGLAQVELRSVLPGGQALTKVLPDKLADLDNQGWLGERSWNELGCEAGELVEFGQRTTKQGSLTEPV
jgi:hypothetical protein